MQGFFGGRATIIRMSSLRIPLKFEIELSLPGVHLYFDWDSASWRSDSVLAVESAPSPSAAQALAARIKFLSAENDSLLDLLTVRELDLRKTRELRKEIEDLLNPAQSQARE